jgi:urease accessory protein
MFAGLAGAHSGLGDADIISGFSHPFAGVDHLLAMLAVGAWGVVGGGRLAPCGFLSGALAGAVVGALGQAMPALEAGIAFSLVCCGLVLVTSRRMPLPVPMLMCAVFGAWHGNAHGLEVPGMLAGAALAGFLTGTAVLHLAGYLTARALRQRAPKLIECGGWALATLGGLHAVV